MQKTWIQLLGTDCGHCFVDGKDISRQVGANKYRRLWSFETREQAFAAIAAWREECQAVQCERVGEYGYGGNG